MATSDQLISVSIIGEFKQLTKATKGSESALKGLNKKVSGFSKAMKGSLAAIGVGFSLDFVTDQLTAATKAALDDRKSQAILADTLKTVTGASTEQVAAVEDTIAGWQKVSAVADDELRPAFDKLVRSVKDTKDASRLMDIAMDVSAGTGKDLTTVATTLGKAYNGNTKALDKLVPGISKAKDPIDALAKSFEGMTETAAKNDPLKRIDVIFGDIQETIGTALLPELDKVADWLASDEGSQFLEDAVQLLKDAIGFAKDLFGWLRDINNVGDVTGSPEAGKALGFTRSAGDTSGVVGNITRGGNMSVVTNYTINVPKTTATAEGIVREVKKLEANNGRKYLFR